MTNDAQGLFDMVAKEYLDGNVVPVEQIVGPRPVRHAPACVWDVLTAAYAARDHIKDWNRELKRIAHTTHLYTYPRG